MSAQRRAARPRRRAHGHRVGFRSGRGPGPGGGPRAVAGATGRHRAAFGTGRLAGREHDAGTVVSTSWPSIPDLLGDLLSLVPAVPGRPAWAVGRRAPADRWACARADADQLAHGAELPGWGTAAPGTAEACRHRAPEWAGGERGAARCLPSTATADATNGRRRRAGLRATTRSFLQPDRPLSRRFRPSPSAASRAPTDRADRATGSAPSTLSPRWGRACRARRRCPAPSRSTTPPACRAPASTASLGDLRVPPGDAARACPARPSTARPFDPYAIRRDFPILEERVNGGPLVWLDNARDDAEAARGDRPADATSTSTRTRTSTAPRTRSPRARPMRTRARARRCAGSSTRRRASEIVFVRGATEGINLIAKSWGRRNIGAATRSCSPTSSTTRTSCRGSSCAPSRSAPGCASRRSTTRGEVILLDEYEKLHRRRARRLVAFTQVSNALGTITPAREMIEIAHRRGATVLLDGAQAVSHMPVDVQALDCDFYVFSGPQGVRPDRHRRGVRQGRTSRRDAPVAGRRQHDRRRHVRANASTSRRRGGSKPAPATSPMPSGSAPRSTT